MMHRKRILITGASGFIGSFIVEEALNRGYETWAAVRATSSRRYLQDERIHFIELNLDSEDALTADFAQQQFDYVVHAAGVTKCADAKDFYRINTEGTKHLVNALLKTRQPLKKLVYLSSLSVFGAIREQEPYSEILATDTPQPNTHYGRSKLQAEEFLSLHAPQLPYIILRPTGVYGPREKDYFLMAKSIKQHTDFAVGFSRQDITFVYVKDVVQAVFRALESPLTGKAYFLSDGQTYQSETFSQLIRQQLGNLWVLRIICPIWLLRIITALGDCWGRFTGKVSALNNDKYHILRQRNWRCDIEPARSELGYEPEYPLERGVKETIDWYKKEHWL